MCYYLEIYFLLFMIYSILGWIMECTISIVQKHKLVNRGFLIGPYCPIYGFGVVGITLLLSKLVDKINNIGGIILIFVISLVICGVLEYFTSYIMEKIFNARWWDYSNKKFNINGRICAGTLIPFGFLSVFILKISNPIIFELLYKIPSNVLMWLNIIIAIIYITDIIVSFKIISGFKNINKQAKDNTEQISKKVRETAEETINKLTNQREKIIRQMKIRKYSILKNIKYTRRNYSYKIKNQQLTILETLKRQFVNESKLNKRLISAFPNVRHKEYTRKRKKDEK